MNELVPIEHQFLVNEGQFELIGYDELNMQVEELGKFLSSIEVTPENIQDSKKLVAQVRKLCDGLNKERIEFKKQYLRPYNHLEQQVKHLTQKAGEYEGIVRHQIRLLEEQERKEKKDQIRTIFNKRLRAYGDETLFPFELFIQPVHLNKSTTLKKVEKEMTQWFETRKVDLENLEVNAQQLGIEFYTVLDHYNKTGNVSQTMLHFNKVQEERKAVNEKVQQIPRRKVKVQRYATFKIKEEDSAKVEQLLQISNIEYSKS